MRWAATAACRTVMVKEGTEDATKKMLNMQVHGKRRRGGSRKDSWDDMNEYKMTKDMAQNQSVWHMKIKAGPLMHGSGL